MEKSDLLERLSDLQRSGIKRSRLESPGKASDLTIPRNFWGLHLAPRKEGPGTQAVSELCVMSGEYINLYHKSEDLSNFKC